MTRQEFTAWIEQHYGELFAVARRRTDTIADAQDVTQQAVAVLWTNCEVFSSAWPYAVRVVRTAAGNLRRGARRAGAARREIKTMSQAGVSHGRKRPAPRAE